MALISFLTPLAAQVVAAGRRTVVSIWNSPVGVVLLHLGLLAALSSALYAFGIIRYLPATDNLVAWDIHWYKDIARGGYTYSETTTSSVAFFPLFPYFWRFTGLDELGISLLNATLFLAAFAWLAWQLQLARRWQLLALSSPLLLFMWVPYTEALFFVFCSLLLVGLHRGKLGWVLLGLLGAGLTRSASSLFTPALLLTVGLLAARGDTRRAVRLGIGGLLALVASAAAVATLQARHTGEPFGFIKAHKFWGHVFSVPDDALSATTGINMLWLEAASLVLGLAAMGICAGLVWQGIRRGARHRALHHPSPAVIFSLGYVVCATLFIIFFQHGNLANLSRYIMATPFMVVLLWQLSRLPAWPPLVYALIAASTLLVWPLFGAYSRFPGFTTGQAVWYFGLVTAYILGYLGWRQWPYGREILLVLYVFNLIIQLHLLDSFLQYYLVE